MTFLTRFSEMDPQTAARPGMTQAVGLSTSWRSPSCCNHYRKKKLIRHLRSRMYIARHVTLSSSRLVPAAACLPLAHHLGPGADAARADPGRLWPGCGVSLERDANLRVYLVRIDWMPGQKKERAI
jgi:hypothetical protein